MHLMWQYVCIRCCSMPTYDVAACMPMTRQKSCICRDSIWHASAVNVYMLLTRCIYTRIRSPLHYAPAHFAYSSTHSPKYIHIASQAQESYSHGMFTGTRPACLSVVSSLLTTTTRNLHIFTGATPNQLDVGIHCSSSPIAATTCVRILKTIPSNGRDLHSICVCASVLPSVLASLCTSLWYVTARVSVPSIRSLYRYAYDQSVSKTQMAPTPKHIVDLLGQHLYPTVQSRDQLGTLGNQAGGL